MKQQPLSGKAIAARRLRETRACDCEKHKPAIITRTKNGKIEGFCEDCIVGR